MLTTIIVNALLVKGVLTIADAIGSTKTMTYVDDCDYDFDDDDLED